MKVYWVTTSSLTEDLVVSTNLKKVGPNQNLVADSLLDSEGEVGVY